MAKRKEEHDEGSPAWMSTFSDLMNLLLCFFVLLFASSTVDAEKLQKIVASFTQQSYSILPNGSSSLGEEGVLISSGVTQLTELDYYYASMGKSSDDEIDSDALTDADYKKQYEEEGLKESEKIYQEVLTELESNNLSDKVEVDYNAQYVVLNMSGALVFDAGEAGIKESAIPIVNKLGTILENYSDQLIEIEGHTDNVPINTTKFESNRYLSSARAIKVYEYLTTNFNLKEENIKYSGYGESRPIASNDTEEGRAKNRRVVVKIYNELSSSQETE